MQFNLITLRLMQYSIFMLWRLFWREVVTKQY
jgi:hypothetical protein